MLGAQIASLHNIAFYLRLVTEARRHIGAGDFKSPWKERMVAKLGRRLKLSKNDEMKLRFPGFKILDRYTRQVPCTYFFAIAMIIMVVVMFDYVEKIDNFTERKRRCGTIIFDYYLNFIPFFINQFSGLFTFIAVIFFTSKMAYQTEIVAMLSGGMSFRSLMWPYFLGALLIGCLSLTLNLWVIPISQRHIVNFESQYIKRKQNNKFNRHIYRQIDPARSPTSAATMTNRSRRRSSAWKSTIAAR